MMRPSDLQNRKKQYGRSSFYLTQFRITAIVFFELEKPASLLGRSGL